MKVVVVESQYAGDVETNVRYARACMDDSLSRGEAPLASHLLYTQPGILRDDSPAERKLGMEAGFAWGAHAAVVAVYTDLGMSGDMRDGAERARERRQCVEYRTVPGWGNRDRCVASTVAPDGGPATCELGTSPHTEHVCQVTPSWRYTWTDR